MTAAETAPVAPTPRRRVLLVEDEAHMMELLKYRLEENEFDVATASDGFAALSRVRDFKPELIILDLMIPKIDGFTICRMLKYNDEFRQIPVIILSARSTDEDIRRGMSMGADAYVTKPYEPAVLLAKVNELLTKASAPPTPDAQPAAAT
jgi:DNA-binding response OmpR family regulator